MPSDPAPAPAVPDLLEAAVAAIGGTERPGQVRMAEAVARAIEADEHLAVQAGTGTGKSLAYLVPAARHAVLHGARVVVSTATIALQRQLVDRDLPRLADALAPLLRRAPSFAILKGRRNYLCLHRLRTGAPDDPQDMLFSPGAASALGRQVRRLHEWSETTATGDRDELVPGVDERAWRQVSVTARECIGVARCPFGSRCFAEKAKDAAARADIVVTNHALLAPAVEVAARRSARLAGEPAAGRLREAGEALERELGDAPGGRMDMLAEPLAAALAAVRDAAAACSVELRSGAGEAATDPERGSAERIAEAALDELRGAADRILAAFGPGIADRTDVGGLEVPASPDSRRPPTLHVAPLSVAGLLATRVL